MSSSTATLRSLFDSSLLADMLDLGYVNAKPHPTLPLTIYNYAPAAQYEQVWNPVTRHCRGLIADQDGVIVARPFEKFFNLEELDTVPDEPFDVFEKLDGSLGIVSHYDGQLVVATRGSFISEQARAARHMLETFYPSTLEGLRQGWTYLFEVIYPENRIVVDYDGRRELVALAAVENATGVERLPGDLDELETPQATRHAFGGDLAGLRTFEDDNREGFVVRFTSGMRVKVKFAEYVRLHRLLTGITPKMVWEHLSAGDDIAAELAGQVPDEFYAWLTETVEQFQVAFDAIDQDIDATYEQYVVPDDRKATAVAMKNDNVPGHLFSAVFAKLDGRDHHPGIWKQLRPAGETAAFFESADVAA